MARILLVDDERFARQLYSDYLALGAWTVETAESAEAALEVLGRSRFDVVVTDLVLPGLDGQELLARIKAQDPTCAVIVITALPLVDPAVRAIKSGAADYLVKPVTPGALQLAVTRALATRDLLREHQVLRSFVETFETCQRIATELDPVLLPQQIADALRRESGAAAVVLVAPDGGRVLAAAGASPEPAAALAPAAAGAVAEREVTLGRLAPRPDGADEGRVLPLGGGSAAAVALLCGAVAGDALDRARYVARSAGLALENASRLAQASDLAYVDDLTRLYNTRYFRVALERELSRAAGSGGTFALLFLDLDRFKQVNDQHGHLVGSKVLVEVGRVVRSCVREVDVVARFGGDEFVVLLLETDSGGALKCAERIRRSIEDHAFLAREHLRLKLTTCVGVAAFPEHARDQQALLDLADRAMYRGKRSTRNVVYIASADAPALPPERSAGRSEP